MFLHLLCRSSRSFPFSQVWQSFSLLRDAFLFVITSLTCCSVLMTFPPFLKILLKKSAVCIHQCCSFNNLHTVCKVLILLAAHFKQVSSSLCGSASWNREKLWLIFLAFVASVGIQRLSRFTDAVLSQATCGSQDKVEEGLPLCGLPSQLLQDVLIDGLVKMWSLCYVPVWIFIRVIEDSYYSRLSCPFLRLISRGRAVSAAILSGWSVMSYVLPI